MYNNLLAEIARKKLTKQRIREELDVSQSTFYSKLNGNTSFTLDEAFKIYKTFFPETDFIYLFQKNDN